MLRNFPPLSSHACLCAERFGGYETDKEWAKKLLPANIPEEGYMPQKYKTAISVSNWLFEMAVFYMQIDFMLTTVTFDSYDGRRKKKQCWQSFDLPALELIFS